MKTKGKVVIALGGNALQSKESEPSAEAQLELVKKTCGHVAEIISAGYEIALVHGNGPQVGRIVLAGEAAKDVVPPMPFDVCGAMSQGYIGYHLQQALYDTLRSRKQNMPVATVITQMVVDKNDPAFLKPTKPIGPFYTEAEAIQIEKEKGYTMKEDAGRGWRRVVASPLPRRIVEIDSIKNLLNDAVVISCGGGGIPVIENADGTLQGTGAVIDKDFAAELLAQQIDADILLILTEVEKVSLNFNTPEQRDISHMNLKEAEKYVEQGHFASGSMLPKVLATMRFVRANPSKKAIISSLNKGLEALEGQTGTAVTYK